MLEVNQEVMKGARRYYNGYGHQLQFIKVQKTQCANKFQISATLHQLVLENPWECKYKLAKLKGITKGD